MIQKTYQPFFQPAIPWLAVISLTAITGLLLLLRLGNLVNYLFPFASLCISVLLYFQYPIFYNGFVWWLWLLSPLVRRFADYFGAGFNEPSIILVAPYLATFVCVLTLWDNLPKINRFGGVPFVFSLLSVIYAFLISLIYRTPEVAVISFLFWFTPIILGCHLLIDWNNYPQYRQNTQRVFVWAVLLLGIYSVIQYLFLPDWDRFWMVNVDMNSIGNPEPMSFRPWSTLNSGEPFAAWMGAALLLVLNTSGVVEFPAMIFGFLSFLLAMIRSGWLGWLAGAMFLWGNSRPKLQIRLIFMALIMVGALIPILIMSDFADPIFERFDSFSNLEGDYSANERERIYEENFDLALHSYLGRGLGGKSLDSTILTLFLDFGWFGTIFYIGGLILSCISLFFEKYHRFDSFIPVSRAIVVSVLIRMPLNNILEGISGLVLWSFIGLGIAGIRFNNAQSRQLTMNNGR